MVTAVPLKLRNEKMSRVQAVISVMLFAGHAKKGIGVHYQYRLEHASKATCMEAFH